MRFCTPMTSAPAPRESAFKSAPHPAAPVGEPSQTRRHHLTPTLVFKQTCTYVQVCAQHFFFSTGRGAEGELPRRGKRSPSGGFSF